MDYTLQKVIFTLHKSGKSDIEIADTVGISLDKVKKFIITKNVESPEMICMYISGDCVELLLLMIRQLLYPLLQQDHRKRHLHLHDNHQVY